MRLVLVRWLDAYGVSASWGSLGEAKEAKALRVASAGYLLQENEDCIVIVPHVSEDGHEIADQQGCGDMTIPMAAVQSIEDLQPVKTCAAARAVLRDSKNSKAAKTRAGKSLAQG